MRFRGRTSLECLTNDIISSVMILWFGQDDWKSGMIKSIIDNLMDPMGKNHRQGMSVEAAMSVASLQYISYYHRYVIRVDECFKEFTGYIGFLDIIRSIESKEHSTEAGIIDPITMRDALVHNFQIENGDFECDNKKPLPWVLIAFSDAISTIGETSLFIIRMKAYLKLKQSGGYEPSCSATGCEESNGLNRI